MAVTKNGKNIRNLYPIRVLSAEFVSDDRTDSNAEYGFGVVTQYNKDANLLAGNFCTVELLCRVTNDDTSTSVFPTSRISDSLNPEQAKDLTQKYLNLCKVKDKLFEDFKRSSGAKYVQDKDERVRLLQEAGYEISRKED